MMKANLGGGCNTVARASKSMTWSLPSGHYVPCSFLWMIFLGLVYKSKTLTFVSSHDQIFFSGRMLNVHVDKNGKQCMSRPRHAVSNSNGSIGHSRLSLPWFFSYWQNIVLIPGTDSAQSSPASSSPAKSLGKQA